MEHFEACGELSIGNRQWLHARMLFDSYAVDDALIRDEIVTLFHETGSAVDPHAATGAFAGRLHRRNIGAPIVTLGQFAPKSPPRCWPSWAPGTVSCRPAWRAPQAAGRCWRPRTWRGS